MTKLHVIKTKKGVSTVIIHYYKVFQNVTLRTRVILFDIVIIL